MQHGFVCTSFVIWRTGVVYFQTGSRLKDPVCDPPYGCDKTGLFTVRLFHLSGIFSTKHFIQTNISVLFPLLSVFGTIYQNIGIIISHIFFFNV